LQPAAAKPTDTDKILLWDIGENQRERKQLEQTYREKDFAFIYFGTAGQMKVECNL